MGEIEFGLPKEVTKPSSVETLEPFDWEGGDNQEEATWLEVGSARQVIFKAVEDKDKAKDYKVQGKEKHFELDLDPQKFSQLNSNLGDVEKAWIEVNIPSSEFKEHQRFEGCEYKAKVIWEDNESHSERLFNFKISDCDVVKVNRPLGEKNSKDKKEIVATKGDLRWLEAVLKNCVVEEKEGIEAENLPKAA